MLSLKKELFRKLLFLFCTLFLLYVATLFMVLSFFLPLKSALMAGSVIIFFSLFFCTVFLFVLQKYLQNMQEDLDAIRAYLEDMNDKKYDAIVKIMHYVEFLHLSLLLKNITKRLSQRAKKS